SSLRGLSMAFAAVLLMLAVRTFIGRYDRLFDDHTIFAGATYTDVHVTIPGQLILSIALAFAALVSFVNAIAAPRVRWLVLGAAPPAAIYIVAGIVAWYVSSFVVKPNELVRET